MKISRLFFPALLALVLLLSQQMGYAHDISHLSDTSRNTSQNKQLPAEQVCDQCLAFAQIGAALTSQPVGFFADRIPGAAPLVGLTQIVAPRTVCVFHSRAPPPLS